MTSNLSTIGEFFQEFNSAGLYRSEGKKGSCFRVFTKHEIRHFHLVVVHRRQRECTKKRDARAKLFC